MNVVTIEKDFKKIVGASDLPKDVQEVMKRLKTFKVLVHPRMRVFYWLLQRTVAAHARARADTLYAPHKYN